MRKPLATLPALTMVLASLSVPLAGATTAHATKPKQVRADGYTCTIVGTPGADKLSGKAGDVVCGLGGNDQLTATGGGLVVLIGGAGNDKLKASTALTAHDVLLGDDGNDSLTGGAGIDDENGGPGQNTETSGTATVTVEEGAGANTVSCTSSSATVVEVGGGADDHHGSCGASSRYGAAAFVSGQITVVTATTITVATSSVSSGAVAWQAQNGNPASVTISIDTAKISREGGGTLAVGDRVHAGVNLPSSGTTLTGLFIRAEGVSSASEDGEATASLRFQGVVTAVSGATITVSYRSVNGAGLAWLAANGNATTVTVDTTGALIERRGGSAIAVGDRVELSANPPTAGTTLLAVKVEASPGAQVHPSPSAELGLVGTIAAVTATTIDVTIRVANDGATTWLAANGNPSVVTVDVSNARVEREGGSSLTVGDRVVVHATAPQSGTVLLGREVEAAPASGQSSPPQSAPLVFQGQVATVGTSSATVTLREANRAARTWLAANGNLTTVALDLTTASIQRSGGGSLQVGDLVQFSATAPVSGTTLVAVRVEASSRSGSSGNENQHPTPLCAFTGTIAAVGQSTITVTLAQVNDAANTYLAANGNPTSVTVDITQARILRDHGGVVSVGDTVAIQATTPTSGTVFTATRVEAEPQHQEHGNH